MKQEYLSRNRILTFENVKIGGQALRAGEIDCYVHDSPTIWAYAMKNDKDLIGVYWKLSNEKMAWAVKNNDFALLNDVNKVLDKWRYSGKKSKIISKWIPYKIEAK